MQAVGFGSSASKRGSQFECPYGWPVLGSYTTFVLGFAAVPPIGVPTWNAGVRSPYRCASVGSRYCAVEGLFERVSDTDTNTNCFGFAAIRCGINGVPVKLAVSEFCDRSGLGIGIP